MSDISIIISKDPVLRDLQADWLNAQRQKPTDCKIIAGEETRETFDCHATIICAASPLIKRMLGADMTEGINREITFGTIQAEIMRLILDYAYNGTVSIETAYIQKTVQACDYLEILKLRDKILEQVRIFCVLKSIGLKI